MIEHFSQGPLQFLLAIFMFFMAWSWGRVGEKASVYTNIVCGFVLIGFGFYFLGEWAY